MSFLFPVRCAVCGEPIEKGEDLCEDCGSVLIRMSDKTCKRCGREIPYCFCEGNKKDFDRLAAPFYYEGVAREAVLRLKHRKGFSTADFFAREMKRVFEREYLEEDFNLMCSVPVTSGQIKSRGFNQSGVIAGRLSELLDVEYRPEALRKLFDNRTQHFLSSFERTGNVFGVYEADYSVVWGKNILLVDDIVTTGATSGECATMLKLRGAKRVCVICAAVSRPYTYCLPK